jgi:hypothetical protein
VLEKFFTETAGRMSTWQNSAPPNGQQSRQNLSYPF